MVLLRFDGLKQGDIAVMEPISEEEENKIEKSVMLYGSPRYIRKDDYAVTSERIYMYGKVDLEDEVDLNIIEKFGLVDEDFNSIIYTDYNYKTGIVKTVNGRLLRSITFDPIKWFKYNYMLLGKPKRIIVYRLPKLMLHGYIR